MMNKQRRTMVFGSDIFSHNIFYINLTMKILSALSLLILLAGCQSNTKKNVPSQSEISNYKNALVGIHKEIVKNQADSIKSFVESKKWEMAQTPTGLWIALLQDSAGDNAKNGDEVFIAYKTSLLNGKDCYNSDSLGYKTVICGRGGVESGIEEALLMLSKGDKARVILPSHLAHGVAGDFDCIPRLAILLYEIEIVDINPR
jgi:FKBP-type peptidyl-prolyl cis-trans isomerase FkpA